jgi:hypothetical protein
MKPRRLIEKTSYGPDEIKALGKAFDDAWARVAPSVNSRPQAIEAARFALANIVLGLAKHGNVDPQSLADKAAQIMLSHSPGFSCKPKGTVGSASTRS